MAKLTSQEFIKKWIEEKELPFDDDVKIEMREDVADSINVGEDNSEEVTKLREDYDKMSADYGDLQVKYDDLKERYKARFLSEEREEEKKSDELEDEEPKEVNVIDIEEL